MRFSCRVSSEREEESKGRGLRGEHPRTRRGTHNDEVVPALTLPPRPPVGRVAVRAPQALAPRTERRHPARRGRGAQRARGLHTACLGEGGGRGRGARAVRGEGGGRGVAGEGERGGGGGGGGRAGLGERAESHHGEADLWGDVRRRGLSVGSRRTSSLKRVKNATWRQRHSPRRPHRACTPRDVSS
ncbi:hypothetical protein DMC30DRAFT_33881 [Rhodotorula diobovata]|uniref:Uncharacterized protein n=1 Tax=Rhodotorula diobovata TaxID=5288 RepID=A0A5C5G2S3_9BASI|nr:hypothetical protein DMC30DRAFT_33881 [Rhodotorula diobovata]